MSGESVVVVRRRGRAEIARLASLYRASGLGRSEFCRIHGMALSTLNRHLKKHAKPQGHTDSEGVGRNCLVEVELPAAVAAIAGGERQGILTVLLPNGRRVEVDRGFDPETLAQLVTVLERL
jgi:hypothetical protein